jgi:hypothetical protein
MSFLTDLTPGTLRATATAVFSAACELTNPLSCTMPLNVSTLISDRHDQDASQTCQCASDAFHVISLQLSALFADAARDYSRPIRNSTSTMISRTPTIPLGP